MKIIRGILLLAAGMGLVVLSANSAWTEEIKPIEFRDFKGELAFEYLSETETIKGDTVDYDSRESIYEETVGLYTKGYIYHPNLFDFDLGLRVGLDQDYEKGTYEENRASRLLEYNAHVSIEKKRPYGFELFALKDQQIVEFQFTPNAIVDVSEYTLLWQSRNRFIPTSVRVSTLTKDQRGVFRREEDEKRLTISSSHTIPGLSSSYLRLDFRDYTEKITGLNLLDQDFTFTNTLNLGEENRKNLTTTVHYFSEKDTNTYDQLTATTDLRWKHTENLESFYNLNIFDSTVSFPETESVETFSHAEHVGIRHQLYDNLKTVASVHYSDSDSDIFKETRLGGDLDFFYVRPVPIGSVRANLGFSLEKDDLSSTGGLIPVVNESHIMSDVEPVLLDNVGVDLDSITITDVTGSIVYQEGIDYELLVEDGRVRIIRLITGQILQDQEVLVDYLYQGEENLAYTSRRVRFGSGLTLFNHFSIDYSFESIVPDILSGSPAEGRVLEETMNRVDARYYGTRSSGLHYELDSFYEDRDSNFSPVKSLGVNGQVSRPFWTTNIATLTSSLSHSEFPDTDDKTDLFMLSGSWTSQLGRTTSLTLESVYRDIGGTVDNQTALELRLRLEAYFRKLRISLNLSHFDVTEDGQDRESNMVYVRAAREF